MQFELDLKEIGVLRKLIELALEEINPEIRRSATRRVRTELRDEREILKHLYKRITQAGSEPGRAVNY